jgi:hypothetical protein
MSSVNQRGIFDLFLQVALRGEYSPDSFQIKVNIRRTPERQGGQLMGAFNNEMVLT